MISSQEPKDCIIDMLVMHQSLSVSDIHQILSNQYDITLSLSQLYYIIKYMTDTYILVKHKTTYTLSSYRINLVSHYAKVLQPRHQHGTTSYTIEPGLYRSRQFSNIQDADTTWFDIISNVMNTIPQGGEIIGYLNHHYWSVGYARETKGFHMLGNKKGRKTKLVIGSSSILDQYGQQMARCDGYTDYCIDTQLNTIPGYSLTIIGNVIVESFFDHNIAREIDAFFDQTTDIHTFDIGSYRKLFRKKAGYTLTIKYHEQQAESLKKLLLDRIKKAL